MEITGTKEKMERYKEEQKEWETLENNYKDLAFDDIYFRYERMVSEMLKYKAKVKGLTIDEIDRERDRNIRHFYFFLQRIINAPHISAANEMEAILGTHTKTE